MNEELRIRSSAESIRRHMSAVHSRKVRVVLVSGVLCIFVGLGALGVVVKKPELLHEALAFFKGALQANGSGEALGSPDSGKALVNGNTVSVSSLMTTASENASSPIAVVGTTTLGHLTSNASSTRDSTFVSSSTATAGPFTAVLSRGNGSGRPTLTTGVEISRDARVLSLNATRTTGRNDRSASRETTLPKRATSTSVSSSSAQSKNSRNASARSSVAPKTAYLVIDSPKEEMRMWPRTMRELEAPEKGMVPPASETGGEEPAGRSSLWYYIESIGANSTSDDMDDEVFGEGDNAESPHPPGL
ncbi:hypothetical protein MRX96_011505 [Rhipicephalus microplus]